MSADEDVNHKESDKQGKDRSPGGPLEANFDEITATSQHDRQPVTEEDDADIFSFRASVSR